MRLFKIYKLSEGENPYLKYIPPMSLRKMEKFVYDCLLCKDCQNEVDNREVDNVFQTSCGAEFYYKQF